MPRVTRLLSAAGAVLAVVAASWSPLGPVSSGAASTQAQRPGTVETLEVPVGPEGDGTEVTLDVDVHRPDGEGPWPAVVLAHGFGGSKDDLADQAQTLAGEGYLTLAYSARGFGASGGAIHLNDPDYEVADARALVDLLAEEPDVRQDAPGDPRVALAGGSYGGALSLMTAGADDRVDSVVALITWHDLSEAFFPQHALTSADGSAERVDRPGPFSSWWASTFYSGVASGGLAGGDPAMGPLAGAGEAPPDTGAAPDAEGGADPLCGRFAPEVCDLFLTAAETGEPDPELLELLRRHSPAPVLADVQAPVHLVQGMSDSLFGTEDADASARALLEAGAPVAVTWFNGGHDGATQVSVAQPQEGPPGDAEEAVGSDADQLAEQQTADLLTWLDGTLRAGTEVTQETVPLPAFSYALPPARGADGERVVTSDTYPPSGADTGTVDLPLQASGLPALLNPPGGVPQATTAVPGFGGLLAGLPTYALSALPGQSVAFDSEPLERDVTVVGEPRVRLEVTSTGQTTTLFVSLWEVRGGAPDLPRRLVAPVQVDVTPGEPTPVEVALPGGTWEMAAGSTWRVLVTATDSAYRGPTQTRADRVSLAEPALRVPTGAGAEAVTVSIWDTETLTVAGVLGALLVLLGLLALRRSTRPHPVREELVDVPLVVSGLTKSYPDGHRAVDDVTWRAEKGQVVGLLGPNGAGKTTTLRMVMGLIRADEGTVHVLGQPVYAGAPVLGRVGALVEGPGFLPHLTGLQNLHAYWAATGRRPEEAMFEEALEIAALGDAVDRPVRSYSHGMRQRLGIAQAMLGMPEVLILDEPTNGLDPPQIAAMRPMLRRYAEGGRTVVVSSHLLAEVEMTCSHVVVMHAGRVLAAGSVAEVGVAEGRTLESVFLTTIAGAGDPEHLNQVRPR
ncbi:alpha/beta fold hydrolase [Ornithinimicrobium sediminis]|uniref:alpha/beta fold hydrolase n=1 Tax=Ornithinimicrobium sediminis TaxID=2904603 RepID=UPI001E5CF426|nr:alpha/beta fold hydrolase [Ornithinimicrobium sediminis]MCE0487201.1 alpha/beta fold hydrolase [Ornithinimicrobium sediminis]